MSLLEDLLSEPVKTPKKNLKSKGQDSSTDARSAAIRQSRYEREEKEFQALILANKMALSSNG